MHARNFSFHSEFRINLPVRILNKIQILFCPLNYLFYLIMLWFMGKCLNIYVQAWKWSTIITNQSEHFLFLLIVFFSLLFQNCIFLGSGFLLSASHTRCALQFFSPLMYIAHSTYDVTVSKNRIFFTRFYIRKYIIVV